MRPWWGESIFVQLTCKMSKLKWGRTYLRSIASFAQSMMHMRTNAQKFCKYLMTLRIKWINTIRKSRIQISMKWIGSLKKQKIKWKKSTLIVSACSVTMMVMLSLVWINYKRLYYSNQLQMVLIKKLMRSTLTSRV